MDHIRVGTGTLWESHVGYSRAVRVGHTIAVSGTTAQGDTAYEQARRALDTIAAALQQLGASLSDVIRTRMYVVDIDDWPEVARAHAEYFADIRPAATMVEVSRLIDPALLVEIEADAVL